MDWETAFFEQYHEACVGRLLRGIVHNLNGVNQAFSLQAALFNSMFTQADRLLHEAIGVCPEADGALTPLQELLRKRAPMVGQMEEKIETCQRIVARILPLAHLYGMGHDSEVSLRAIIDLEMEILAADTFFKHRIDKAVDLPPNLPTLRRHWVELHTLCYVLLENAVAALRDTERPALHLKASSADGALRIEVRDTGCGIEPTLASRIFEPFVSTRKGALGVGLFLAQKTAKSLGGSIDFSSTPGDTCFAVTVPLAAVA